MIKTLDTKLQRILADPACHDFILADAKDADMAYGLSAPGQGPEAHGQEGRFRTLDEYRQIIRTVVEQGLVDIVLMSSSTSELLTIKERLFDNSPITPAIRANDTSDIWLAHGSGRYREQPALPFRSASLDHAMCGHVDCAPEERTQGVDLGLYSITYNNNAEADHAALTEYQRFRHEAEGKGFRHFLEVFPPNATGGHDPANLSTFICDSIVRTLAGVTSSQRPVFLKIPYLGPKATEELARYDRSLIVGILGGAAGTTFDAFHMLWEAKRHGARVALYGRKINQAEDQLAFIRYLRALADGQIEPVEAVKAYHNDLQRKGIRPHRPLEDDLARTSDVASYGGQVVGKKTATEGTLANSASDSPDFSRMSPQEKAAWNMERWKRILEG